MGAGKGSRIKYNLGKKMPKCLLPSCIVSPKWIETSIKDTILHRIIKSFKNASKISGCNIEFDLMISHKSLEVKNYINKNFPDVNLHQINWDSSSIYTFFECIEVLKSKSTIFDQCIFINGDTYIDNIESISYTLADMINNEIVTSAIVENFNKPLYIFSSVNVVNNLITDIFDDYTDTTETLCDIVQFNPADLNNLYEKFLSGYWHEWWETAFYNEVNKGGLLMGAIPVRKISYDRVLYNTNNIQNNISEIAVNNILTSCGLNFKEEENFNV